MPMPAEMHLASLDVFGRQVIEPAIITSRAPLRVQAFQSPDIVPFSAARRARFRPVPLGWCWGPAWSTCWFRLSGRAPTDWNPDHTHLRFSSGTEALLWGPDGPAHGFDANRDRAPLALALPPRRATRAPLSLLVEAACNHPFGVDTPGADADTQIRWSGPTPGRLLAAELVLIDPAIEHLWHAWSLAVDLARELLPPPPPITTHSDRFPANLPWQHPRCEALLLGLRAAHRLLAANPADIAHAASPALRALNEALAQPPSGSATICHAVGHAHIDTAWLWPIRETRRKCQRTFASVLALMDRYPDFRFVASQAQHYAWIEHDSPGLFRRIKAQVDAGRWDPAGAMWIEPDCNIPSGESLVRQITHGTRYWTSRFGPRGRQHAVYLPDTFGFPPCLPNIMNAAGLGTFITNKISWNDSTPFPHTTFIWQGLADAEVLAHFTPGNDYNATNSPRELRRGQTNHRSLAFASATRVPGRRGLFPEGGGARWLQPFGFGDGGGGPTAAMIENAARAASCDGLPRVQLSTLREFCSRLHDDLGLAVLSRREIPSWRGELYLERHRGTLSTHAWIKHANRQAEDDLRLAEGLLAGSPAPLAARDRTRAIARLDQAWKLLLTNQFHDILPGSSIAQVYLDARRDHATIRTIAAELIADGLRRWATALSHPGASQPVMVMNPVSARTVGEISLPASSPPARLVTSAPAFGARVIDAAPSTSASPHGIDVSATTPPRSTPANAAPRSATLANEHLIATVDALGQITSLRVPDEDGNPGPELAAAPLNALVLHDDRPRAWDAWDIDDAHAWAPSPQTAPASRWTISRARRRHAGESAAVVVARPIGSASSVTTTIKLSRGSKRLDITHRVTWREHRRLLRAEFPLALQADFATFQTQFGRHTRPTSRNTPQQHAAFEVPIQRWIDVSDPRHGVAVLNDRTFGGSARQQPPFSPAPGTLVALSLLRSPQWPDPTADRGPDAVHEFRFAILPHEGPLAWANVDEEAEALHRPLIAVPLAPPQPRRSRDARPTDAPSEWAPVEIESSQPAYIQISALKFADDGQGVILRIVETAGAGDDITIRWNIPASRVSETDLLERQASPNPRITHHVPPRGDTPRRPETRVRLRPFEILTLRAL